MEAVLGAINFTDILLDLGEDVPAKKGRKKKNKNKEEPTEEEMLEIAGMVEVELDSWSIYVCSACEKKADLLLSKFDGEGNVVCPHCNSIN